MTPPVHKPTTRPSTVLTATTPRSEAYARIEAIHQVEGHTPEAEKILLDLVVPVLGGPATIGALIDYKEKSLARFVLDTLG